MTDDFQMDWDRQSRIGLGEAVFCADKTPDQIERILDASQARNQRLLFTRLSQQKHAHLSAYLTKDLDYDPESETGFFMSNSFATKESQVAIVTAGTSDAKVAREAARTLEFNGIGTSLIFDVGVAGLWRLNARIDKIRQFPVVIAVAGMDAALVSVLGGLVSGVIIAVPTSTGYGAARNGETALAASLVSCSAGVVVCNIDNGFGAACAAIRILGASSHF